MTHTSLLLKQMQSLPLKAKVAASEIRIRNWMNRFWGEAAISFSGGKDSTVLLHLVRRLYPNTEAVFVDTGLEYPEIKKFVRNFDNVTILRPKMSFREVIEKYGYPVISKDVASAVERYRRGERCGWRAYDYIKDRFDGTSRYLSLKKWRPLLQAPFKISASCCDVLKKRPFFSYAKKTGKTFFTGQMASESRLRKIIFLRYRCNMYEAKIPRSNPISFWTENDVLQYIAENGLKIASVYGSVEPVERDLFGETTKYKTTGLSRTGCMFCMFGVHLETYPNRFQQMKRTHPSLYDYCINRLGIGTVLDFINVNYY